MTSQTPKKEPGFLEIVPRNSRVPIVLLAIFVMGTAVVILGGFSKSNYLVVPALLWAFGFCVSGMLLGFLFAIPRTLPSGAVIASAPAQSPATGQGTAGTAEVSSEQGAAARTQAATVPASGYNEINSNLVEVSDWLTKIIVGVGLVELKDLPKNAESVAAFIAPSLGITPRSAIPIAGGIMLFFSVLGFLIGYLVTRIYLAVIIKWADNMVKIQNEPVRLPSGREIDLTELSRLQQTALSDLQQTVAEMASATPQNAALMEKVDAASAPEATAPVRRVLWVDDIPENNTLLVEQLIEANVKVDQAISTEQAVKLISANRYDVIVTDMGRVEGKSYVADSGVVLTRKVKELSPNTPVLVFTSGKGARMHGSAAMEAGARLITASGTRLISALNQILNPSGKDRGAG